MERPLFGSEKWPENTPVQENGADIPVPGRSCKKTYSSWHPISLIKTEQEGKKNL